MCELTCRHTFGFHLRDMNMCCNVIFFREGMNIFLELYFLAIVAWQCVVLPCVDVDK